MFLVEGEAALPSLEEEALAKFEQEALDLADDGGFKIRFGIPCLLIKAEEFEYQRLFQQVLYLGNNVSLLGELTDPLLVAAERETFVEAGVELPFELTHFPALRRGFDFVEASFSRIL